jgi:carbonic anhydrase
MITSTLPGELFIVRNIANMVPKFSNSDEYLTIPAAIEYAVNALKVRNIVICGHSNCGGIGALFKPEEEMKGLVHTKKWLELGLKVKENALKLYENDQKISLQELTEKLNIVEQLEHLMSYPYILKSYNEGILSIMGWYYKIETGEIFNYNRSKNLFDLIN